MKVKLLSTGDVLEACDSYGLRLLEQGKAVLPAKEAEEARKPERKGKKAVAADGSD